MKTVAILFAILGLAVAGATVQISDAISPTMPASARDFFMQRMKGCDLPGMAVAILHNGEIAWTQGLGTMNVETGEPITEDTLFHVASVSKTITATAVMQLAEQGLIDLDSSVDEFLPFVMRHPDFPGTSITPRMLLTHSGSLRDDWESVAMQYTLETGGGDPTLSLADCVEGYFSADGQWFDAERNFMAEQPGTVHEYSNMGFAVLGALVENVSGQRFSDYCRRQIFEPLGMTASSWMIDEVDANWLAHPHLFKRGDHQALPHYSYPSYPDGALRTSVKEYALFLQAMMNDGIGSNGARILDAETVAEMITPQTPDISSHQAIAWNTCLTGWIDPQRCDSGGVIGHTGGDPGVFTIAFYVPEEKSAAILFANGSAPIDVGVVVNLVAIMRRLVWELDT